MRRRVVPFITALAAVATFATGCGLTDQGPRPGVAAEVDGETLRLAQVDEAVEEYCVLRAEHPEAVPVARASIRAQFTLGWTQAVAVERLAAEYDVSLPPEKVHRAAVEAAWGELGEIDDDNYEAFAWLTWIQARLTSPVEALGSRKLEEETGQGSVGQAAVDRGVVLIQEWMQEEDLQLNPVLGELDEENGLFSSDALSVPVSDEAKQAASTEQSQEYVANLPAGQRCGPEAASPEVGQG
ncbi:MULTISPECIES: hypothetical protein [Nocardioides]|uniref:Lipoprotein n=1 Tax=Nocardioides vastitatis TaxID=2568655 RepID=A0ABW0ZPT8_9ACTN|nr:hypothetical protein [Nocardioides sp.]THI93023.1 hypothetical protein E7Z54_21250 [Nocardioides sp.]